MWARLIPFLQKTLPDDESRSVGYERKVIVAADDARPIGIF